MAAQATGAEARNAKRAMAVAPPRPAVRRRTYESRMRHERESENNEKARGVRGEGDSGWQQGLIPFLFVFCVVPWLRGSWLPIANTGVWAMCRRAMCVRRAVAVMGK